MLRPPSVYAPACRRTTRRQLAAQGQQRARKEGRGPREAAGARRSLALEFWVYDGKSAPVSRRGETGFAFRFHRLVPGSDFVTEHRVVEEGRSEAGSALGEPHGSDSDGR